MPKQKSNFKLDKAPMDWEDKETTLDRITKCESFLAEELATNGRTVYAQDLETTIKYLER